MGMFDPPGGYQTWGGAVKGEWQKLGRTAEGGSRMMSAPEMAKKRKLQATPSRGSSGGGGMFNQVREMMGKMIPGISSVGRTLGEQADKYR
jgi:hypothetical protein